MNHKEFKESGVLEILQAFAKHETILKLIGNEWILQPELKIQEILNNPRGFKVYVKPHWIPWSSGFVPGSLFLIRLKANSKAFIVWEKACGLIGNDYDCSFSFKIAFEQLEWSRSLDGPWKICGIFIE